MKYAIYFTWNDGTEDSFNVYSAKERDTNIKEMIERKDFKSIEYCPIYANGEYGINIKVLQDCTLKTTKNNLSNLISSAEKRSGSNNHGTGCPVVKRYIEEESL